MRQAYKDIPWTSQGTVADQHCRQAPWPQASRRRSGKREPGASSLAASSPPPRRRPATPATPALVTWQPCPPSRFWRSCLRRAQQEAQGRRIPRPPPLCLQPPRRLVRIWGWSFATFPPTCFKLDQDGEGSGYGVGQGLGSGVGLRFMVLVRALGEGA